MVDIQELSDDSSSSSSSSSGRSSKRDSSISSSPSSSSSSSKSDSIKQKIDSTRCRLMTEVSNEESSGTNDMEISNNNDRKLLESGEDRLKQSRLTFLFDSDSHGSIDDSYSNIMTREQAHKTPGCSGSSLDSSSPLSDTVTDNILREQDAQYIQSKYGNQNILLDNSTSFSYATSKLFASIAAAGGEVCDNGEGTNTVMHSRTVRASDGESNRDRNRIQGDPYSSSPIPSNDTNDIIEKVPVVTNPYVKQTKSGSWNNAASNKNREVDKHNTEKGQKESKSSYNNNTISGRKENDNITSTLVKEPMNQSQPQRSVYPVIHPSFYKPPPYQQKPEPTVHKMNIHTRPLEKRTNISISSLFPPSTANSSKTIADFWRNKYDSLNHMQTELSHKIVNSDDNIVVSAPTGAGKTCVFEMAMGALLQSSKTAGCIPNTRKIVYISPSKALCEERYNDWSGRFIQVDPGIEVVMVTGDDYSSGNSFENVASAHIILTTPEKWDSITRKWTDHLFLIGSVKLLMIDEVHLLGDESRGSCLETLVCRMKTVQRAAAANKEDNKKSVNASMIRDRCHMRIVCVSATLPNIDDIASFVDAHDAYEFDASYRPVPLSTHVVGLGYVGKNQFLFDKGLNKHVPDLLRRFSNDKPSIVFCHTKKQTESLASELSSYYAGISRDTRLVEISNNTNLEVLKRCLRSAVAYHHAGMEAGDRHLVEKAFAIGAIKCLCATSTLAMGVNLPAHLVIIKGTACWRGSGQGYSDIDSGTLLQMMGRAGRPGFDSVGTAVIMTDMKSKENYERLSGGLEVVESMLLKNLVETLNTEISQSVINNVSEAIDWLKGTFFYLRVRKNPRYYKLFGKTREKLEDYLMKLCMEALENLHSSGIIRLLNQGSSVVPNQVSHIMSKHMVPFRTMQLMIDLPYDSEAPQILQMLSQMEGIHYPVRRSEKSLLNEAHKQIKYKLDGPLSKVRVQNPQQKAFVLLQCAIGHIYLQDYTLRQEMSTIVEYSKRMLSSFEDYSIEESRHGKIALECMLLRRCLATSLWGPSDFVLNQIQGIGLKTASKLAMNGIRTFGDILTKSSNAIEDSCGRTSPFGQQLRTAASKVLQNSLGLSAYVQDLDSSIGRKDLVVQLTYRHGKDREEYPGDNEIVSYTLSVFTDRPGGSIMFRTHICGPCEHKVSCPNIFGCIYIHLVANLVGLDESLQIDGESEVAKPSPLFSPKTSNTKKEIGKVVSSSKSKLPSIMNDMVKGISDIRMKRKSTENFATSNNVFTPESSLKMSQHVSNLDRDTRESSMVTPSPHTPLKQSYIPNNACSFESAVGEPNQTSSRTYSSFPTKRFRTVNSSNNAWQKEQKKQQNLQKRAFRSPKENPFAAFKFDPNDVEKVLEQESKKMLSEVKDEYSIHSSIIPPRQARVIGYDNGSHSQRRSRFFGSSRNSQYKSFFVGSATRNRVGSAHIITGEELLRLKAQEQQIFALSRDNHQFRGESNKYMSDCKRMPFHGQASLIGPPYNYDQYNHYKGINNNILYSQRSNVCDQMHQINNNSGYVYNGVDQNYFDHLYTVNEPLHDIEYDFNSGVDGRVHYPSSHHDFHVPTGENGFPRGAMEGQDMNEYQTNFQRGNNDPMMEPNPYLNEYISHQNEPRNLQGMVITVEGNRNEDEIFDDAFL